MHFDYADARKYCSDLGLAFDERALPAADEVFAKNELTQAQVNALMRLYSWNMAWYFNPANYGFVDRIKLAVHFLLGTTAPTPSRIEG